MSKIVLEVENLSKQYRLGNIGTGTMSHDLNRWWHKVRGKEDPYLKLGQLNDRTQEGGDYVWALKEVSFQVEQGDVLGIIGKNGAGKSTLLKLLSQVTTPTTGEIRINGRIASLLEVGTGFHPELTGRENVFLNGAILGMTKAEIESKLDEIIEFSGCAKYIDTPVKRYSSGMMVRLGFAVAAHLEPEILVVDEVLAVGDQEFQDKCIGKMKDVAKGGRTVLFVSHNMASIKALCPKTILMDKGTLLSYGKTDDIIKQYKNTVESNEFTGLNTNPKSSYPTEFGKITQVSLFNTENQTTGEFMFEEIIGFNVHFFLNESVKNINIDLRLVSSDGIVFSMTSTLFNNTQINSSKGENNFIMKLANDLNPGVYSIGVGIHFPNNSTIDYVPEVLVFKVSNTNEKENKSFFYNWGGMGYNRIKVLSMGNNLTS